MAPNAENQADIAQAFGSCMRLGALDVGQAAVVCEGLALAVEAAEGTDAMLARIGSLRESVRGTATKKRGVLVKALKPTQDAKTDMPVVGVQTVKNAAAAFLAGIAVEAGEALILDKRRWRPRPTGWACSSSASSREKFNIMIVCGEPSGDALGAQLMAG